MISVRLWILYVQCDGRGFLLVTSEQSQHPLPGYIARNTRLGRPRRYGKLEVKGNHGRCYAYHKTKVPSLNTKRHYKNPT
jgi:hypothetical protein